MRIFSNLCLMRFFHSQTKSPCFQFNLFLTKLQTNNTKMFTPLPFTLPPFKPPPLSAAWDEWPQSPQSASGRQPRCGASGCRGPCPSRGPTPSWFARRCTVCKIKNYNTILNIFPLFIIISFYIHSPSWSCPAASQSTWGTSRRPRHGRRWWDASSPFQK